MYDSALATYSRGEELARRVKDTGALYGAFVNISTIHHDRGNNQKELEYLMKSQELVEGMNDPNNIALMRYNLAVFYMERGEKGKAFELSKEAYETYITTGDLFGQASVHTLWAGLHKQDLTYDSSLHELDEAIALYQRIGAVNRVGLVMMNQSEILWVLGKKSEALQKI